MFILIINKKYEIMNFWCFSEIFFTLNKKIIFCFIHNIPEHNILKIQKPEIQQLRKHYHSYFYNRLYLKKNPSHYLNSTSSKHPLQEHLNKSFLSYSLVQRKMIEPFVMQENPKFIQERLKLFNALKEKKQSEKENDQAKKKIDIVLLDGSVKEGVSHVTTPMDIALSISKKLAEYSVVAKVTYTEKVHYELCDIEEGEAADEEVDNSSNENKECILWDMGVPLLGNCKIEFCNFDSEEGKKVYWHSSAHILGSTMEKIFGGYLTIGPALKEGFYYDMFLDDFAITNEHYTKIEEEFNSLVKKNEPFEKLICTKQEVLELFKYNPFKLELIRKKIPDEKKTSVYKCGDFIDLCLGPHIRSTGMVKAFKVLKNSSAYWLGDRNRESLQRVYGISFEKKTKLTEYLKYIEEAKQRDHRNVGKKLSLFFFEKNASAGSCFWLPYGAKIYNKLIDFIRREYRLRNYEEVITPNIYSCDLWKTSGHYQNYKDCMFIFDIEKHEWGMKPMNCPAHCLLFKQLNLSYRSLPIRIADFGVLHRNEISGSLTGLTRVRRFQQDDSHIFCAYKHIKEEVQNTLKFIFFVYDHFNFTYELFLSTRPDKYIGEIETWDFAEQELKNALDSIGISWKLNKGDGAFYGPKIDILLKDSLNRTHQCGTIQLDFQLPLRFNLQYKVGKTTDENENEEEPEKREMNEPNESMDVNQKEEVTNVLKKGHERPIIIHRAILGSVERFIAIVIEHTAGKLPFWISPRQAIVLPVSDKFNTYANYVQSVLNNHFFDVETDLSLNTLNKKIREAQLKQFNYILVVGDKELKSQTVTVRDRDDQENHKVYTIQELIDKFNSLLKVNSQEFNIIPPFHPTE